MRQLKTVGGDAGAIQHDVLKVAGALGGNGDITSAAGTLAADGGLLTSDARAATLNPPPACADRADFLAAMSDYQSAGSDMQTGAAAVESSDYGTADAQLVAGSKALLRGTRHLSDAKAAIDRINAATAKQFAAVGSSARATASASPSATHHAAKRHQSARSPVATVRAYFKAINNHDYARAWHLGGRYTGSSYSEFVSGFQGTAHDIVTILSVSGNVVTARLTAHQTDGSVRTYQGTYRVSHGVIVRFHVAQVGSSSGSSGSSSGCTPKAPSGNCYEPGEYCPESDAGMTGVAGDGKVITCEIVSGRYHWED